METRRVEMTPNEVLERNRQIARKMLDGTYLVPTTTCRKCGHSAVVKDGMLEKNKDGWSSTAVVPEITRCLDLKCGHVAAMKTQALSGAGWKYGRATVEIVDGPSYNMQQLPQPITTKQRARLEKFVAEAV